MVRLPNKAEQSLLGTFGLLGGLPPRSSLDSLDVWEQVSSEWQLAQLMHGGAHGWRTRLRPQLGAAAFFLGFRLTMLLFLAGMAIRTSRM